MQFFTTVSIALALGTSVASAAHLSAAGLAFLKKSEGYEANFYTDPTGHKTICYGLNCDANPDACASLSPPLTEAQCSDLLVSQTLPTYLNCACSMEGMTQANANEFSGLVDYAYNAGCGSLTEGFPAAVKEGRFADIASALLVTKTNGGLLDSRRKGEHDLMLTATSDPSSC